jgi:TolA-binding protein
MSGEVPGDLVRLNARKKGNCEGFEALFFWLVVQIKGEFGIMKRKRFWILAIFLAVGCGGPSADSLFEKGEQATHDLKTYPQAEQYLAEFLTRFPDEPRVDIALQALARVLMNQSKWGEAIARYRELLARFPESRYCAQAQFMIGYIYDQSGEEQKARSAYQKVIRKYPHSDLVDDARISIQNMGKTPERWLFPDSTSVNAG